MKKLFTLLLVGLTLSVFGQVKVTFKVDATGVDAPNGMFIVGDVNAWKFVKMTAMVNNVYKWDTMLVTKADTLAYYFITVNSWDSAGNQDWNYYKRYRENIDTTNCHAPLKYGTDRALVVPDKDITIMCYWGKCPDYKGTTSITSTFSENEELMVYPNPGKGLFNLKLPVSKQPYVIEVFDLTGRVVHRLKDADKSAIIDLTGMSANIYIIKVTGSSGVAFRKVLLK